MIKPVRIEMPLVDDPPIAELYYGVDVLEALKAIPDGSIQCCVTSPPYWGLRNYGSAPLIWGGLPECTHQWETGNDFCLSGCGAWKGQLGQEPTPQQYVQNMVVVFREIWRVLRPDGTLWLNLGDSFAGSWGNAGHRPELDEGDSYQREKNCDYIHRGGWDKNREVPPSAKKLPGLKPKDLIGIPWRVAFALQEAGWWLRSDIVWAKPNPMPESIADRPTRSHEYVFLLAKSKRYHYNIDAIREPAVMKPQRRLKQRNSARDEAMPDHKKFNYALRDTPDVEGNPLGRNKRDVWWINTKPYRGAHFAVMPEELVEVCLKAGCAEGSTVLDPFSGSATTGVVAMRLGHNYKGIDLNQEYLALAEARLLGHVPPAEEDADEDVDDIFNLFEDEE